jgi:hypothetical protein
MRNKHFYYIGRDWLTIPKTIKAPTEQELGALLSVGRIYKNG